MKTNLFVIFKRRENEEVILEKYETYAELKDSLATHGDIEIERIIRGREIPFKAQIQLKFF